MEHEALLKKVEEIMDKQKDHDTNLQNVWTGDVGTITSAEVKSIRILELSVEYRKRELRKEKSPASKTWEAKSEPSSFDKWKCVPDWLNVSYGWDDSSGWKDVGEYWDKCSECDGSGDSECSSCGGSGGRICPRCNGTGSY